MASVVWLYLSCYDNSLHRFKRFRSLSEIFPDRFQHFNERIPDCLLQVEWVEASFKESLLDSLFAFKYFPGDSNVSVDSI